MELVIILAVLALIIALSGAIKALVWLWEPFKKD
jgi:hypothetical protein